MGKKWIFRSLMLVLCMTACAWAICSRAQGFYLHDGDTVVYYGDSITAQDLYNQWVTYYTITRFPAMRIHFYDEGVGGDRVTGGGSGPIDERLSRLMFSPISPQS